MKNISMAISLAMLMTVQVSAMDRPVDVVTDKIVTDQNDHANVLRKLRLELRCFFIKVQKKNEAAIIRSDVDGLINLYNELFDISKNSDSHKVKTEVDSSYDKVVRSIFLSEFISKASCYIAWQDKFLGAVSHDGSLNKASRFKLLDDSARKELLEACHDLIELFKRIVNFSEISNEWKEKVEIWLQWIYDELSC